MIHAVRQLLHYICLESVNQSTYYFVHIHLNTLNVICRLLIIYLINIDFIKIKCIVFKKIKVIVDIFYKQNEHDKLYLKLNFNFYFFGQNTIVEENTQEKLLLSF